VSFKQRLERKVALKHEIERADVDLIEPIIYQLRRAREAYPYLGGKSSYYKEVNALHDEVVRAIMKVYFPFTSDQLFTWEDLIDFTMFRYPGKPSLYKSDPWRKANQRTDIEERIRLNDNYQLPRKYSKQEETLDPKDYGFE